MDHTHGIIKTRSDLKDELIATQSKQYTWLSAAAAGFAAELIAMRVMSNKNTWKEPVIFASSMIALGGIAGDIYHSAHRHKLQQELQSTTSLHPF